MRPALTEADRRLVSASLDVARHVARVYPSPWLDYDERLSAAYLGLCEATLTWGGRSDFAWWARLRARRQVMQEIRKARRRRHARLDRLRPDQEPARDDRPALERSDLARTILARLDRLSARERAAIEGLAAGLGNNEVARRLGVHHTRVGQLRRAAAAKLIDPQ